MDLSSHIKKIHRLLVRSVMLRGLQPLGLPLSVLPWQRTFEFLNSCEFYVTDYWLDFTLSKHEDRQVNCSSWKM